MARSVPTSLQGTTELKTKKKKILSRIFKNFITLRLQNIFLPFEKSALMLYWGNWVVNGINFAGKGNCYQMERPTCVDREPYDVFQVKCTRKFPKYPGQGGKVDLSVIHSRIGKAIK